MTSAGSCDFFVVETDVHYPTDINLLYDAMRKTMSLIAIVCSEIGIAAWRQKDHNIKKDGIVRELASLPP